MHNENIKVEILATIKKDVIRAIDQSNFEMIVLELNDSINTARQTALSKVSHMLVNALDSYYIFLDLSIFLDSY